jgi:hypothetical protein
MTYEVVCGSRGMIVYLRIVQALLLVAVLLLRPQASEPPASWFVVIPFVLAEIVLYRVVYARLTAEGIEYRRLGKWKFIGWPEVETATMRPFTGSISLKIAGRPLWSRYLLLGRPTPPLSSVIDSNKGAAKLNGLISK